MLLLDGHQVGMPLDASLRMEDAPLSPLHRLGVGKFCTFRDDRAVELPSRLRRLVVRLNSLADLCGSIRVDSRLSSDGDCPINLSEQSGVLNLYDALLLLIAKRE